MNTPKTPPRYVPTLTQIVQPKATHSASVGEATDGPALDGQSSTPLAYVSQAVSQQLEQQLLSGTRHYLDVELQRRIREAVSQLALEHAHKIFEEIQPLLEATISQVVQEAVDQAVKQASKHGS